MSVSEQVSKAVEVIQSATGFEAGAEVRTDALLDALGIPRYPTRKPGESDATFARRVERHRMGSIGPVVALREVLLEAHKVDLRATHRGTYVITPPGEQATRAAKEAARKARAALREGQKRIVHVNTSKLTREEMLEREAAHLNTAHRLAFMSQRKLTDVLGRDKSEAVEAPAKEPMPMPRR